MRFPSVGKEPPPTPSGNTTAPTNNADDTIVLLQDCRLMRKDELQVIKPGMTSRAPDCFQRVPRRINLPPEV